MEGDARPHMLRSSPSSGRSYSQVTPAILNGTVSQRMPTRDSVSEDAAWSPRKALRGGISNVNFQEILSTYVNKCQKNGSNNDTMAPRTTLGYHHEGPRVVYLDALRRADVGAAVARSEGERVVLRADTF